MCNKGEHEELLFDGFIKEKQSIFSCLAFVLASINLMLLAIIMIFGSSDHISETMLNLLNNLADVIIYTAPAGLISLIVALWRRERKSWFKLAAIWIYIFLVLFTVALAVADFVGLFT